MRMKNKIRITIILLVSALMFPCLPAGAEQKITTADELAEAIYVEMPYFKEIELSDKRTKLNAYTVQNYLEQAERQIKSNDKNIEQAKSVLNSPDTSTEEHNQCRYQIEYLKINDYELQRNKLYYETQNKLSELYDEYSDRIVDNQKNTLKYNVYKSLCEIKAYEGQEDYLKNLEEQKKAELNVIEESFKIGYATENNVLSARAEYEAIKSERAICKNNHNMLVNRLEKETGIKIGTYSLTLSAKKKYDSDNFSEQFNNQSFYAEYYLKQSEIYKDYSDALDELMKRMYKTYKEISYRFLFSDNEELFDRIYDSLSNEKDYYDNESEIYEAYSERYTISLEIYILESCENLNTLISQRAAKISERKSAENLYTISQKLFKEGRINEASLTEARVNLQKVRYEIVRINMEIMTINYALINNVENINI